MKTVTFLISLSGLCLIVNSCIEDDIKKLQQDVKKLASHLMMQSFAIQEQMRTGGNSGVKSQRRRFGGRRPYFSDTHTMLNFGGIHNHADHPNTVGMGEVSAVMNGVEFRTRHNDYMLVQAGKKGSGFHVTEPIEYPPVPPAVTAKVTVEEQIVEMREWFKAWRDGDHKVRDYRDYFRPILCYMEGAWLNTNGTGDEPVIEPFESDRHFLNALDHNDLTDKITFMANSGSKNNAENYAYLPSMIYDLDDDNNPIFAQWHYRILCHPLKKYIKPNRMRPLDDLSSRMAFGRNMANHAASRAARFKLNHNNSNIYGEGLYTYELLDELMAQIPGKDNKDAVIYEDAFNLKSFEYQDPTTQQNAAKYHRNYRVEKKGATGADERNRGFNDDNLYMAMTTRPEVATNRVRDKCKYNSQGNRVCPDVFKQKWSYAFPLELIYTTPLWNWNPYNILHYGTSKQCETCKGGNTTETAYNGTDNSNFYRTPAEFFTGSMERDDGDTSGKTVGVLNYQGKVCKVKASGTYIFLPDIDGVGSLRQRYPIAPIYDDGSPCRKEVEALKDLIFDVNHQSAKISENYSDMMM